MVSSNSFNILLSGAFRAPLKLSLFVLSSFRWIGKTVRSSPPLTSTGLASIRMNAVTAGTEPLLTQVCMVDDDVAGPQMDDLATIEFEVNFT